MARKRQDIDFHSGYNCNDLNKTPANSRGKYPLPPQETHTLCVFDQLPVVSWRRAKYKQMYGLKSTLTVSR